MIAAISSGAIIGPGVAALALLVLAVIGRRTDREERRLRARRHDDIDRLLAAERKARR